MRIVGDALGDRRRDILAEPKDVYAQRLVLPRQRASVGRAHSDRARLGGNRFGLGTPLTIDDNRGVLLGSGLRGRRSGQREAGDQRTNYRF